MQIVSTVINKTGCALGKFIFGIVICKLLFFVQDNNSSHRNTSTIAAEKQKIGRTTVFQKRTKETGNQFHLLWTRWMHPGTHNLKRHTFTHREQLFIVMTMMMMERRFIFQPHITFYYQFSMCMTHIYGDSRENRVICTSVLQDSKRVIGGGNESFSEQPFICKLFNYKSVNIHKMLFVCASHTYCSNVVSAWPYAFYCWELSQKHRW